MPNLFKDKWWIDDLAPFLTDAGDEFWPINCGEFDTDDETRVIDVYHPEIAEYIVALHNSKLDKK